MKLPKLLFTKKEFKEMVKLYQDIRLIKEDENIPEMVVPKIPDKISQKIYDYVLGNKENVNVKIYINGNRVDKECQI